MNLIKQLVYPITLAIITLFFACQNTTETNENTSEVPHSKDFTKVPVSQEKAYVPNATELSKLGIDTTKAIPKGLEQGTKAPVFRGVDQNGNTVSLKEKLTKGSVVLVFYRGEWCGVCNRYLSAFADSLDMIQQNGVSVIAIAPEIAKNAQKTAEKTGLDISIISDTDLTIMNAYGVTFNVNQAYQDKILNYAKEEIKDMNGMEDAYLPVPATYVINPSGIISYVHFDHNYRNRPSIKELMMSL